MTDRAEREGLDPDFPPPGSRAAIEAGCICPVIDNAHGRGYRDVEGIYIYTCGCPLHDAGRSALIFAARAKGDKR